MCQPAAVELNIKILPNKSCSKVKAIKSTPVKPPKYKKNCSVIVPIRPQNNFYLRAAL